MKIYKDKDWLFQKYIVEGLTVRQVAELAECSKSTVQRWLAEYGYSKHSESDELLKKQADELMRVIMQNQAFFLEHVCETEEERQYWLKIIELEEMDKDKKLNLAEKKKPEGRVLHNRQTHPGDRIEHGGGQPLSSRYYDPRSSGNSYAEEMSLIEELDG